MYGSPSIELLEFFCSGFLPLFGIQFFLSGFHSDTVSNISPLLNKNNQIFAQAAKPKKKQNHQNFSIKILFIEKSLLLSVSEAE